MEKPINVLIVDDSELDSIRIAIELEEAAPVAKWARVDRMDKLVNSLAENQWDTVLLDYIIPGMNILDAIKIIKIFSNSMPVIIVSGIARIDIMPELIKAGASDFISKDELSRLPAVLERELSRITTGVPAGISANPSIPERPGIPAMIWPAFSRLRVYIPYAAAAVTFLAIWITLSNAMGSNVMQGAGMGGWTLIKVLSGAALIFSVMGLVVRAVFEFLPLRSDIIKLKNAMNRLSEGDFGSPVEIKGSGEIQDASRAFEKMRNRMKNSVEKLKEEINERNASEQILNNSHLKLTKWVSELDKRIHEITLLNQMGKQLQTSKTVDEFYTMALRFSEQLFPDDNGAIYILNESKQYMEAASMWGKSPMEHSFPPEECRAIRSGHIFTVDVMSGQELLCGHIRSRGIDKTSVVTMCVPMIARGEIIGMYHLRSSGKTSSERDSMYDKRNFAREQLVGAVAESATLALSNLKLQDILRQQSIHDPLTGLFNRRYMADSIARELYRARRHGTEFSVIMMDIDHFKKFNDTYGHTIGDLALESVGRMILNQVRPEDVPCRYGGEEFFILLPGADIEGAFQCADRIMKGIRNIKISGQGMTPSSISLSFGIASYPDNGSSAEQLVKSADNALLRAKSSGRDRIIRSVEKAEQPVI